MLKFLENHLGEVLEYLALPAKDTIPPPIVDAAVEALQSGAVDEADVLSFIEDALGTGPITETDVLGYIQDNLGDILALLATPVFKAHFPPQTVDTTDSAEQALANGEIVHTSWNKIVIADDNGNELILRGLFIDKAAGDKAVADKALLSETSMSGTIWGFESIDDGTTVATGHGHQIDLGYFLGTAETDGADDALDQIFNSTEIFKGSQYGDTMQFGNRSKDAIQAAALEEPDLSFTVMGMAGDDWISTGDGSQKIFGGKDNDTLFGGYDDDRDFLIGGKDQDFFQIAQNKAVFEIDAKAADPEAGPEVDFIVDFSSKDDTIQFLGELRVDDGPEPALVAAKLGGVGFIGEDQFVQGPVATTEDHRFVYTKETGELFIDQDGSGEDYGQQLIAQFVPGTHVEASDIYVNDSLLL